MKFSFKYFLSTIIIVFSFSCTKEALNSATENSAGSADVGKGGSLARFTIVGNYLYAVDNRYLYSYNIADPKNPVKTNTTAINFDLETIYSFKNRLFIGSRVGLYIYSIDTPSAPSKLGEARHLRSCDPVVATDSVAYATLKGTACGPAEDGLYVYDIKNIFQPLLNTLIKIKTPEGLGLQDTTLYVCCNTNGLRIYNVTNPYKPVERKVLTDANYKDVITYGNLLICYVTTGILLYDISDPINPVSLKLIAN
ncbi:MAG TPA: hypothetical protein VGP43_07670 [Chitinophagaceae bacterium]|nr:hypothetical protein [Chitinophagaceae bacterium]